MTISINILIFSGVSKHNASSCWRRGKKESERELFKFKKLFSVNTEHESKVYNSSISAKELTKQRTLGVVSHTKGLSVFTSDFSCSRFISSTSVSRLVTTRILRIGKKVLKDKYLMK